MLYSFLGGQVGVPKCSKYFTKRTLGSFAAALVVIPLTSHFQMCADYIVIVDSVARRS